MLRPFLFAIWIAILPMAAARELAGAELCSRAARIPGPSLSLVTPLRCIAVQEPAPQMPPKSSSCEFCERLRDQTKKGCTRRADGYSPFADSLFGRHALGNKFPPYARRALMAATLAQDPDAALDITEILRASAEPRERYAANLVAAYAFLRSNRGDRSLRMKPLLAALAIDRAASGLPTADVSYLRALVALDGGQIPEADSALEEALSEEPQFFSALALSVQIQLAAAVDASLGDTGSCNLQFRQLISRMHRIMDLSPCLTLAAHLEVFLARRFREPSEHAAFNIIQVYLGLVSRRFEFAESRLAQFERSKATCREQVAPELRMWMTAVLHGQSAP